MTIDTTINITTNALFKLDFLARAHGKSRSAVIAALMQHAMKESHKYTRHNQRIQYQNRHERNDWILLHIYIHSREYEFFIDMRKLFKRSVSLILSIAIDKYSKLLLNCHTDNYSYHHYILIQEHIDDDAICWRIYWGLPRDETHLFPEKKLMH